MNGGKWQIAFPFYPSFHLPLYPCSLRVSNPDGVLPGRIETYHLAPNEPYRCNWACKESARWVESGGFQSATEKRGADSKPTLRRPIRRFLQSALQFPFHFINLSIASGGPLQ